MRFQLTVCCWTAKGVRGRSQYLGGAGGWAKVGEQSIGFGINVGTQLAVGAELVLAVKLFIIHVMPVDN